MNEQVLDDLLPPTTVERELVRGNVKASMDAAGAKSSDLWNVPYEQIRLIPGWQPRINNEKWRKRVAYIGGLILANGYAPDKPVQGYVAREGGLDVLYLTEGHTRYHATGWAREHGAKIERIPMIVLPKGTTMVDLTVAQANAQEGTPLAPYELGILMKRMIGYQVSVSEIARRFGYSEQYVNDLLSLMGAPSRIRQMVIEDKVSAAVAVQFLKSHGDKAEERLLEGLKIADSMGQTRVTRKVLSTGPKVPPRYVPNLYDAMTKVAPYLQGFLPGETAEIPGLEDEADLITVKISKSALEAFRETHLQVTEAMEKRSRKQPTAGAEDAGDVGAQGEQQSLA